MIAESKQGLDPRVAAGNRHLPQAPCLTRGRAPISPSRTHPEGLRLAARADRADSHGKLIVMFFFFWGVASVQRKKRAQDSSSSSSRLCHKIKCYIRTSHGYSNPYAARSPLLLLLSVSDRSLPFKTGRRKTSRTHTTLSLGADFFVCVSIIITILEQA